MFRKFICYIMSCNMKYICKKRKVCSVRRICVINKLLIIELGLQVDTGLYRMHLLTNFHQKRI